MSSSESGNSYDSGYSGRDSSASNMTCNPDMQSCIPQIMQLLDQVHSGQQQLLQLWQIKKTKLDQCLQLRLFEQECEKVTNFIRMLNSMNKLNCCKLICIIHAIIHNIYLQMFDWIYHNRDVFLSNYVDIGHSFSIAKKLQEDHNHFTLGSNVSNVMWTFINLMRHKKINIYSRV